MRLLPVVVWGKPAGMERFRRNTSCIPATGQAVVRRRGDQAESSAEAARWENRKAYLASAKPVWSGRLEAVWSSTSACS